MLKEKRKKTEIRPKTPPAKGGFVLDLQEGDTIHFLSGSECEHRRGGKRLGRYQHVYDDDTSESLSKAVQRTQMALVPGMEAKVKGPNETSMGKKDGPPSAQKAKADKKPEPPPQAGERWITIHNHPENPEAYTRIKIRVMPDGTGVVIGGAGGSLNQLHLTRLRSPEEWKQGAAERKAKREEKEKKRKEAQSEEEQGQEKDAIAKAKEYHRGERHSNALETLKALDEAGIGHGLTDEHRDALTVAPSADTDPEEAKRVEALAREALGTVQKVHQAYEQKLINDHDARAAAKLGDTALNGLGNVLQEGQGHSAYAGDGEKEVSSLTQLPNGEWLVRSPDGADQSYSDWEKAAKAHAGNVAEHDGTTGERSQPDDFYNPKLWVRQHEDLPEGFAFKAEAAGKIAALAQQRKEIDRGDKNAEKAIKKGMPWSPKKGADVQGTEIDEQAAIAALESDAKTIEDAIVHGKLLDLAGLLDPKAMRSHLSSGGLAQLGEIASDVLKANPVDPALVQQLGHNEAAKLLAYQIRQAVGTDAEYQAIAAAQAAHHGQWSTEYAQQVIDQNQPLVDQLSTIHKRMLEIESQKPQGEASLFGEAEGGDYTTDQLIELDNLAYQSQSLQDSLSKSIGTALGQLQASAAMTLALESNPRSLRFSVTGDNADVADVPGLFSRESEGGEEKPSIWATYGLDADDFSLDDGPDGQLVSVKPSGMEKLAGATYDPADREEYERAIAIKRGDFDEENFTPNGFAYRAASTFTDLRAEAQQFDTKLAYRSGMSDSDLDGAIRQYLGARVANGDNPLSVRNDLFSPELYANLGLGESDSDRLRSAVDAIDRDLFKGSKVSDADVRRAYQELGDHEAGRQRASRATDDMQALHSQAIDHETAKEAAHRTLAAMPMARAAMKPLDQTTARERKYLREYAITEIMGEELAGPESEDDEQTTVSTEPAEEFGMGSLFGGPVLSPEQQNAIASLQSQRDQLRAQFDGYKISQEQLDQGIAELNDKQAKIESGEIDAKEATATPKGSTQWQKFSKLMGGDARAYEAIRDKMKGQFYNRFASAYGAINGKPMLTGRQTSAHVDRLMAATLPDDQREQLLDHMRSLQSSDIAKLRSRQGGKFAVELDDVLSKYEEIKGNNRQFSLLTTETKEQGKGDEWQRTTLGKQAEQQLDNALSEVMPGFDQIDSAVNLYPEVRWNGGFVAHQRGLKFLEERKKIGMHYSAGCVHGSTVLKCHKTGLEQSFHEWWLSGDRPWVKALDEATGQAVVTQASPVFVKAYDRMYRVTLESGKVITVTGGHRFLGRDGWVKLADLAVGAVVAIAKPMTEAHALSHKYHRPNAASTLQSAAACAPPSTWGDMLQGTHPELAAPSCFPTVSFGAQESLPSSRPQSLHEWGCRAFSLVEQPRICQRQAFEQFASGLVAHPHIAGAVFQDFPLRSSIAQHFPLNVPYAQSSSARPEKQKAEGFLNRYSACSHQHDEQPLPSSSSDLNAPQLLSDVLARIHGGWRWDALGYKPFDIHGLAMDCVALASSLLAWLGRANTFSRERPPSALREKKIAASSLDCCFRGSHQCDERTLPAQGIALNAPLSLSDVLGHSFERCVGDAQGSEYKRTLADQQSAGGAFSKISKIELVERSLVFDITVPGYQNYLAHGIWNHNSGKSAGMIGAFTHLHSQGKVQRSIVAVPSGIIGQIVGECATFLEPGKYNYSANMGWDREKRIEALKNPDLHLFFSTRESLANDLLHLVEKHTGVNPDDFQDTKARTESDRRDLMLTALKNEGIDPKSLLFSVDEAHDLARRKGVAPSKRSLALDALAYHSEYHVGASGTPLKNDVSEIADFLQKVGAPEAEDMDKFMARYGKNTAANTRALQRITAKYAYAIAVKPTTKDGQELGMRHEKPRIPLTQYQKDGRQTMLNHYETIRKWKQKNLQQAMAAKVEKGDTSPLNGADLAHAWEDPAVREAIAALAPDDYASMSDEQKQAAIGGQVLGASAMKFTALSRLYHRAPYEHNAKAQHTVKMAQDMVKAGKPGVIFSASSEAAAMLRDEMAKQGIRVGLIDGSMSSEQKSKERLRFSPGKGVEPEVDILIATDAAQTGLNLQRGKFLAHYDVPLTQKAWDQRSARIYRRGQTEDVEVHTLMADAPEDEIALARMERKGTESSIFQGHDATRGHSEVLDDSGLAGRIAEMRSHTSLPLPQAA